ncbi:hypothetical protein A2V47_03340 [Candidatus Atribacteria bacterium RBG_19FT_COMBO_35_14]|uniref:Bacterial PH domain-containing protein n=1 Tax=Candidatus Sediminicultor quintus TaxID=1797291 RepID=A0A1F5AA64_9BACT|nr:MAG: hypothetical protein A2V47_03340 [Candidatus Atribacteria bacterium RBG_19FT_COMBO_35_14]OGD32266.1 MAG: hypothetical protein A2V94_10045 [Candidatus Atribacteria bacterium RBG_16_35_8]
MIKTYNPKETKKWLEYSSLLVGVILIIWGVISRQTILLVLGFFFILVVSNKTEIIIDKKGILITTKTLFLMKRKDRLNFKEMGTVEISEGAEKSIVYFMRGWKGRKVFINTIDLAKLIEYIKNENPELIKKE